MIENDLSDVDLKELRRVLLVIRDTGGVVSQVSRHVNAEVREEIRKVFGAAPTEIQPEGEADTTNREGRGQIRA